MKLRYIVVLLIMSILLIGSAYYLHITQQKILRVSTTTSLYATGLLDELAEAYMKQHPDVNIHFIAVGSGEALRRASMGDADLVFVHAPNLEVKYIEKGYLIKGVIIAYNYFVIVGPPSDPAKISNLNSIIDVMHAIYSAGERGKAVFVSRGDKSGTHQRELYLWKISNLKTSGDWYIETGSGMSETLLVTNEKLGYTLTDTGTFLKLKREGKLPYLEILYSNDSLLINIYSMYIVNPDKVSGINYDLALDFYNFVIDKGMDIIASYGVEDFGQPLFNPVNTPELRSKLHNEWSRISGGR